MKSCLLFFLLFLFLYGVDASQTKEIKDNHGFSVPPIVLDKEHVLFDHDKQTLLLNYPPQIKLPADFTPIVNYKPRLLGLSPDLPVDLNGKAKARLLLQQGVESQKAEQNIDIFQEKAIPWSSLGAFLLLAALSLMLIYRPRLIKQVLKPKIPLTPQESALERLEELAQLNLPLQSKYREFYTRLTKILEEFLANQHHLLILTKTAEELADDPEFHKFILTHESAWLSEWMQKSNRIKYAEGPIQLKECQKDFERIRNFIR